MSQQPLVDPGPVTEAVAAAVAGVCKRTAERMLGRYTCDLGEDERLLTQIDAQVKSNGDGTCAESGAGAATAGVQKGTKAKGKKRQRPQEADGSAGQDTATAGGSGSTGSTAVPPRLAAAVVARASEKRVLAGLLAGGDSGAVAGSVTAAVTGIWSQPRPGMHGVKPRVPPGVQEGESESEGEEESEEDGESESGSEGGCDGSSDGEEDGSGGSEEAEEEEEEDGGRNGRKHGHAVRQAAGTVGGRALTKPDASFAFNFNMGK